jgi:tetratricopeptide (TPR) repeat protein
VFGFFFQNKLFEELVEDLSKQLKLQKNRISSGLNFFQAGITAHNLGVAKVLAGLDAEAEKHFREAIDLKQAAFGEEHEEVALSWDQLGIQLFAQGMFAEASEAFQKAHLTRKRSSDSHPILAVTLNNMACCDFQRGEHQAALQSLEEARTIQHSAASSPDDLDLLHVAIVYGNCGYLKLALKKYDEARAIFEEALLIQQSVLDDNHRAVRDTLSNIEFTNAFHF